MIEGDPYEAAGVNSRAELAHLELEWQRRRREQALDEGATLIDPESVWFAYDTRLGRDVTVEPHVVFGPGVEIADGATIHAFSHIEGAMIGAKASIGPFARIRPGTRLADRTKVGNFVELKKAEVGEGAKVNHLSYVGDASVGARRQHRRGHDHLQLRRVRQVSDGDRRGRLHRLQHARWWHRSRSATARSSAPDRSSRATSKPTAWRSNATSRRGSPAGRGASASG